LALTSAQKADIRYFLGWSARFQQTDSRLEQAMSAIATVPDSEALVITAIASCKTIDTNLVDAWKRLKAIKVGSIALPVRNEINTLRSEGRRFASRIASTLGVEIRADVFSGTSYRGYATYGGVRPGGNYAPQG
jgi:hypothetical protein